MKKRILTAISLIPLLIACATKSQMNDMSQRVGLLEVKLNRMEQSLEKARRDQAEIKADLIDIRTNTQSLTGQLSQKTHEEEKKSSLENTLVMQLQNVQQQSQLVDKRLRVMEGLLGVPPPPPSDLSPPPPLPTSPPAPDSGKLDEVSTQPTNMKEAYEVAFNLYKDGNMDQARAAFERFLASYPTTELSDNALFWIGETHYQTGNYKEAIVRYHELLEKHPKGSKVPDALLKQGLAFAMIGENDAAISSLKKLIQKYPDSPLVKTAQKKLESLEASEKSPRTSKKPQSSRKESPR